MQSLEPAPPELHAAVRAAFEEALANVRLGRAATAEQQLRALQARLPGEIQSLRLLAVALLDQDKVEEALAILERVVRAAPGFYGARSDLGRAYRRAGRLEEARSQLKEVLTHAPTPAAWLAYGDVLVELEKYPDACVAYERARLADPHRERIDAARQALQQQDRKSAETICRAILREDASHVGALCGLAAVSLALGRAPEAERLLRHALKQSAHLPLAWRGLCQTLVDQRRLPEAEAAVRKLLRLEPENVQNWLLLGTVCTRLMRQADALIAYQEAARLDPKEVRLRLTIGHLHKTLGQRGECERAYRDCLALDPSFGEAYWSLADLKNYTFSDAELGAMQALVAARDAAHSDAAAPGDGAPGDGAPGDGARGDGARGDMGHDETDRAQLHFALGRALEQRKDYVRAFEHYATGNRLRRKSAPFDIEHFEDKSRRVMRCFDAAFFESRRGTGQPGAGPIFIVGLPRSGSTLIEQILASHSLVEGTFELPNVLAIVRELDHADATHDAYPEKVLELEPHRFAALGRRYLEEVAPIRSDRPFFIDKMPNNFSHIGIIHAMMPEARIIDVRRHPLDACFSTYKQYFAEGQSFSYDLEDLGRYYRSYLALMDHWDAVLPGRVLPMSYERLVADPEREIRRLLAHCGLPFEPACLAFHETRRAVRTASAEQVRQPLYRSGVGYWKHFSPQLEPLRQALGDCLERFQEVDVC